MAVGVPVVVQAVCRVELQVRERLVEESVVVSPLNVRLDSAHELMVTVRSLRSSSPSVHPLRSPCPPLRSDGVAVHETRRFTLSKIDNNYFDDELS